MTFCGCCGRNCKHYQLWCSECYDHVRHDNWVPFHERTFFAIHGIDCPNQEADSQPLSTIESTGETGA